MNKKECDKDRNWQEAFTDFGIKNICTNCQDVKECRKPIKKVWGDYDN